MKWKGCVEPGLCNEQPRPLYCIDYGLPETIVLDPCCQSQSKNPVSLRVQYRSIIQASCFLITVGGPNCESLMKYPPLTALTQQPKMRSHPCARSARWSPCSQIPSQQIPCTDQWPPPLSQRAQNRPLDSLENRETAKRLLCIRLNLCWNSQPVWRVSWWECRRHCWLQIFYVRWWLVPSFWTGTSEWG